MVNESLYIDAVFCLMVLPVMMMSFQMERWLYDGFLCYVIAIVDLCIFNKSNN